MTVKTRAELNSDADAALADNTTGDVTVADVRQRVKYLADSAVLPEDLGDVTGKITVSTSDPSSGADGDIWLKYA